MLFLLTQLSHKQINLSYRKPANPLKHNSAQTITNSTVIRQKSESQNGGNKTKQPNFPKNEHFLPPDTHTLVCLSEGKKCSFSRKFGVFCFLATSFLRFVLLPYYRGIIVINSILPNKSWKRTRWTLQHDMGWKQSSEQSMKIVLVILFPRRAVMVGPVVLKIFLILQLLWLLGIVMSIKWKFIPN